MEIAYENGRISNYEGLVTLTLTLNRVILHTVVHHSSTSTYMLNLIEIEENFRGRINGRTDGFTDENFETCFIRSTLSKNRPNKGGTILLRVSSPNADLINNCQFLPV